MWIQKNKTPWQVSRIQEVWRFTCLNLKIIMGVYYSKILPEFRIKYKISFRIKNGGFSDAIVNTRKPPQVGDVVTIGRYRFQVMGIRQLLAPKGEFCFLEVECRTAKEN